MKGLYNSKGGHLNRSTRGPIHKLVRRCTFHQIMALLSALLFLACVIVLPFVRLQIPPSHILEIVAVILILGGMAGYYNWRGILVFREFCLNLLWIECVCTGLMILVAAAGAAPTPLVDSRLAGIDAALGLQTPVVIAAVSRVPFLSRLLAIAYSLSLYFAFAAFVIPAVFRRIQVFRRALLGVTIAGLLTVALFVFFPAVGPWTVYGFHPNGAQVLCENALHALKSAKPVDIRNAFAIVSFPSFHAALAVICLFVLWRFRLLRIPSAIMAAAICIATVSTGWHYVIDVIGGIVVAIVSYALAAAIVARTTCIDTSSNSDTIPSLPSESQVQPVG